MIYDKFSKSVGEAIKQRRLEKNMTLDELAQRIGVTKGTVQKYESGQIKRIGEDKLNLISKVLELSILELSPPHYASLNDWSNLIDARKNAQNSIMATYGERTLEIIIKFDRLTYEGQEKLLERADELLEINRYNQEYVEYQAEAAREQDY